MKLELYDHLTNERTVINEDDLSAIIQQNHDAAAALDIIEEFVHGSRGLYHTDYSTIGLLH